MERMDSPLSLKKQVHSLGGGHVNIQPSLVTSSRSGELSALPIPSSVAFETHLRYTAIYVVGPSSSGKTTLCDALVADIGLPPPLYVKEVARNVMRTQGFTRNDVGTFEMQSTIMNAQLQAEEKALNGRELVLEKMHPLPLLSDRSAIDPIVYGRFSAIVDSEARDMELKLRRNPKFEVALHRYRKSLFVVLAPVQEWIEDDGVRSLGDPRRYNETFLEILRELDIPFREIGEGVREIGTRVRLVKEWANIGRK